MLVETMLVETMLVETMLVETMLVETMLVETMLVETMLVETMWRRSDMNSGRDKKCSREARSVELRILRGRDDAHRLHVDAQETPTLRYPTMRDRVFRM